MSYFFRSTTRSDFSVVRSESSFRLKMVWRATLGIIVIITAGDASAVATTVEKYFRGKSGGVIKFPQRNLW